MNRFNARDLIFMDESGANLRMSGSYARAEGGNRINMPIPFHGPHFSMIGAISCEHLEADC